MLWILLYSSIVCLFLYLSKVNLFRFDFIFSVGMLFSSLLAVLPILEYPVELEPRVVLFLIGFHFSIFTAFNSVALGYGGAARNEKSRPEKPAFTNVSIGSFQIIRAGAIIFCLLGIASNLLDGSIPILSSAGSLAEIREGFSYTEVEGGVLARSADAMSHFGILFIILSPLYLKRRFTSRALVAFVLILVISHSLESGARATIVITIVGFSAVFFSLNRIKPGKIMLLAGLAALLFYVLAVEFYLARNPEFGNNPDYFISRSCAGAASHPSIADASDVVQALNLSLCYFSSPPYYLQHFMDQTNWRWDYSLGAYNLGFIFRDTFVSDRLLIAHLFDSSGYGSNPWSTFARDMFIDFGFFAFAAAFAFGLGIRLMTGTDYKQSDMRLARFGFLAAAGFMAPFISPILIRPIVYPILLTFLLPPVLKLLPVKGRVSPPPVYPNRMSGQQPGSGSA